MRLTVSGSGSQILPVKGCNPSKFRVSITSTTFTDIDATTVQNVRISAKLTRKGNTTNIVDGTLPGLVAAGDGPNLELNTTGEWTANGGAYIVGDIDLKGIINLSGDDTLFVECTVGAAETGQVTTVDVIDGIGLEVGTPRVSVFPVLRTSSVQDIPVGDNVISVSLVSNGLDPKLTSVDVYSDKGTWSYSAPGILGAYLQENELSGDTALYSSGTIISTVEPIYLNNVRVSLGVNTAGTIDAYVVVHHHEITPDVTAKMQARAAKFTRHNAMKYGV